MSLDAGRQRTMALDWRGQLPSASSCSVTLCSVSVTIGKSMASAKRLFDPASNVLMVHGTVVERQTFHVLCSTYG